MSAINRLREIMAALRHPETGCPWDLEQDMRSIVAYTIEEAYEVADAIEAGERAEILDELGDLLFQSVFLARLAEEKGWFDFDDVADAIATKLIRRHPHVFAKDDPADRPDAGAVKVAWEAVKSAERAAKQKRSRASQLDDIPVALPALQRAQKMGSRAARVGFDWAAIDAVFAKLDEELLELREALTGAAADAVLAEAGDVLLTVVSLCRHAGVSAERALREANSRFALRFRAMERQAAASGQSLEQLDDAELDRLWIQAKDEV
ncbi:MAG: nucleoside triphosphate pyrophosphohydrolase [Pseudomonadota bacterium]